MRREQDLVLPTGGPIHAVCGQADVLCQTSPVADDAEVAVGNHLLLPLRQLTCGRAKFRCGLDCDGSRPWECSSSPVIAYYDMLQDRLLLV